VKKVILVAALVLAVIASGLTLYMRGAMRELEVSQLTPDLYMLNNQFGGNIGVLKTGAGAVVVDTLTFGLQGEAVRELAEELTGEKVVMVINSHYHIDHTHGNPAFDPATRVVATERTLHHLQQLDEEYFSGEASQLLPKETFEGERELRLGNNTLRLLHPGRGHTDGDLVVLFVEDRVLHTGDLFFNRHYPNIDLEAGGSVVAWGDTLDPLFALPFEQVIPGHGAVSDAAGMRQFQQFIRELAALGSYAASIDGSLADTLVNGRLTSDAGYAPISFGPLFALNREFVIRRSWEEATDNFELYEGF
jgi:cyclase